MTHKRKHNKGRQDYTVLTVNGRVRLWRRRWHSAADGTTAPLDGWVDAAEASISLGVREMACRLNGDGTVLAPDDKSKYTLAFGADGVVRARIDCNRAQGGWKSAGPNQLEFGPMAITRAQCPPGSLHDQIVKQLPYVRSYVMKQGHLFLSLMADGGIYEFEPVR